MYKLILLTFILFSNALHAADQPNACVFLSIAINNNTNWTCSLIKKDATYGVISSGTQVPTFIPAYSAAMPFEMSQAFYGPDITLTYQCGDTNQITFRSQQDLCVLSSGNMVAEILGSTNMKARSIKEPGSWFWGQHGVINWTLEG